jgi:DNA polymerase-1
MTDITDSYKLFHDGILALAKVESAGLHINIDYVQTKKKEITKEITKLEHKFIKSDFYLDWEKSVKGKINIYSPVQLSNFLYKVKKLKIDKQTTSEQQGSTDEEALLQLNIPELNILLQIKKLKKIRDTYLDSFERETINGIMHPFYNLHLVRSYRGSSNNPNFQNIPKRDEEAMNICRSAIYPSPGHQLVELDFKQLEVRIAACFCEDQRLIDDILKGDMHRDMAMEIFQLKEFNKNDPSHAVLRQSAKNGFIFPQFYGDYYKNCAINIAFKWCKLSKTKNWKKGEGIVFEDKHISDHLISKGFKNLESFTEHIQDIEYNFWHKRYKKYYEWREHIWQQYQNIGYVETMTGFTFNGLMKKNDVMNYPIQGSAFHCLLWSLIQGIKAQQREHWQSKIVGQIHDSIVLDVTPKELKHVIAVMRCIMCHDLQVNWPWIIVPLDIDVEASPVDHSWAEKQSLHLLK